MGMASFIISEGWIRMKPKLSQRRAPLEMSPNTATPTSKNTAPR